MPLIIDVVLFIKYENESTLHVSPPHRSLESWAPIIFSFSHFLFLSVYLTPKRAMNKTNLSNWAYQLENFPNGTFYFGNTRSADLFNDRNKIDGLDLWRFDPENMRNNRRQKPKPTEKEQWNTHRKCYTSHHSRVCYNNNFDSWNCASTEVIIKNFNSNFI